MITLLARENKQIRVDPSYIAKGQDHDPVKLSEEFERETTD